MRFSFHLFLVLGWMAMANPLVAQPTNFDSLYTNFAQAKTDSAKLVASFDIIRQLEDYQVSEQKTWLDTTAASAARLPGHELAVERQLYLANWMRSTGDMENAYRLAMECADKFRAMKDTMHLAIALYEAGTTLSEFNPKAALEVLQDAVGLSRSLRDDNLTARILTNLSYAMEMAKLNKTERYRTTLEAALEVFRKNEDMDGILVTNFNLVEYFTYKRQFERARQCISEMNRTLSKVEDEVFLIYPIVSEANVLMGEGRIHAAVPKYEAGWHILDKYGIIEGQLELYPTMIEAYKAVGDFPKAFQFLEAYQLVKDSLLSAEKNKTVQGLQTRYETEKKEAQIAAQQSDLVRSRQEKWGLGAGLALLSGLSVLFWRQRRKTQAANLELAASNDQIQQKNQKLDLLMRELHHRVKNNLQLVSSLLRLQSRQVGDEGAAAAIKAGQLRVEAMSLIHQRLYREEGITLVNMQEFARDLAEKIAFTFNRPLEEVDFRIEFQPKELDVDKAMPLSLILNELLTNSFKYAFGKAAHPAVRIELSEAGGQLRLHYADNGMGLPENANGKGSFGSKLITSLSGQLGGPARQWNDGGAHFELFFEG